MHLTITNICSLFFLLCLFKATILNIRNNIETTNIYAYYIPDKGILVCTDKPYSDKDLDTNDIGPKDEFDCLIKIKDNSIYNVNISISKTVANSQINKLLNMKIGKNLIFYNVDLDTSTPINKSFIIKTENRKIYETTQKPFCIFTDEGCRFREIEESSILLQNFIKITFFLRDKLNSELDNSALSLYQVKIFYPNSCVPTCIYGVCYNEVCLCKSGYSGENCSIPLKNSKRGSLLFFIGMILLSLIMGISIIYCLWHSCSFLIEKNDEIGHKDIVLIEEWQKAG